MATLKTGNYNPDVLTCIANLSNDEIFTPPWLAEKILNDLDLSWRQAHAGESIWNNPNVTFLDPFTKTGVFLREITKRLVDGLADEIPDLQERVNHVLTKQVFGIAVTQLTALMTRRSVYCSKSANGKHSICTDFDSEDGNIWFDRVEHDWTGGKRIRQLDAVTGEERIAFIERHCRFCGANEADYGRGIEFETHAYAFIHTDDINDFLESIFGEKVHFDVVIGNPPYTLSDGGHGKSSGTIYSDFVEQAKALEPRYLSMIIPSRWFAGGKGLDDFRDNMLSDRRIRSIDDYLSASEIFPGVGFKGGVCYFLWDRDNPGNCRVTTHYKETISKPAERPLLENGSDVFIRFNEAVPIFNKVMDAGQPSFENLVSSRKPFGLTTTFRGHEKSQDGDLFVYQKGGTAFASAEAISVGLGLIDCWKVFVGRAAPGTGNRDTYPHRIISTPFIGKPGEICSETYLCIGPFSSEEEASNVLSYLKTKFARFMILLHKAAQDTTKKVYRFVPVQDWTQEWTDELLNAKYGLSIDEISFIESMVRDMEA